MTEPRLATLDEAADLLGLSGRYRLRRTRRHLAGLEQRTGLTILVKFGGEGHGTRYRVSLPGLRTAMPEAFEVKKVATPKVTRPPRAGSLDEVRQDLREWVLSHDEVHDRVEARLDELYALIRAIAGQLGERVTTVERQFKAAYAKALVEEQRPRVTTRVR